MFYIDLPGGSEPKRTTERILYLSRKCFAIITMSVRISDHHLIDLVNYY